MSKEQEWIMWIGLFLVLIYLFTDVRVRDLIFNRGANATPQTNAFLTDFVSSLGSGTPSSTGNIHSNTGNSGSVKIA